MEWKDIFELFPYANTKSINKILDHLLRIENYEPFYLNLSPADKEFLETTAVEQGFSGDRGYLNFIYRMIVRVAKAAKS